MDSMIIPNMELGLRETRHASLHNATDFIQRDFHDIAHAHYNKYTKAFANVKTQ